MLHLGAADAGFHRSKGAVEPYFIKSCRRVSAHVVGIDNNKEAIRILRDEFSVRWYRRR